MTRIEEILHHAIESGCIAGTAGYYGFLQGAEWADRNPKNPWRDAKTSKPKRTGVSDYDDWTSDVVYVMMENGYTSSAYYDHLGGEWRDYGNGYRIQGPTYWMPIPELPKGGEK